MANIHGQRRPSPRLALQVWEVVAVVVSSHRFLYFLFLFFLEGVVP